MKIQNAKLKNNNLYTVILQQKDTSHILLNKNISGKEALNYINKNYEVSSFKKETPTMEEVFITAVKNA